MQILLACINSYIYIVLIVVVLFVVETTRFRRHKAGGRNEGEPTINNQPSLARTCLVVDRLEFPQLD
jgi:hypothetical protein